MMLNSNEIKEIIQLVDQSSIQRFELEQESTKIVIVKTETKSSSGDASLSSPAVLPAAVPNEPVQRAEKPLADLRGEDLVKIISPIVGTFYAAPEPGADPFVILGQKVAADTVVCVLESMKLFNEVEAGTSGEIVEILAKDGDFVEYGQTLFLVKPLTGKGEA